MRLNTYTCVHAELPTPTAHKECLPKKALQEEPCHHLIRRMLPSMSQMSFVSSALVLASCKAGQLVAGLSASRARTASADQAPYGCGSHEHVVWEGLLQGFCVHLNKLGCLEAASAQCRCSVAFQPMQELQLRLCKVSVVVKGKPPRVTALLRCRLESFLAKTYQKGAVCNAWSISSLDRALQSTVGFKLLVHMHLHLQNNCTTSG